MAELPECIKNFKSRLRGFFGLSSGIPKQVKKAADVEGSSSVDPTELNQDGKQAKQEKTTPEVKSEKKTPPKKKAKVKTGLFHLKTPGAKSDQKLKEGSIAVAIQSKSEKKLVTTMKVIPGKIKAAVGKENDKIPTNISRNDKGTTNTTVPTAAIAPANHNIVTAPANHNIKKLVSVVPTVKPVNRPCKPTQNTNVNVSSTTKPTVGSTAGVIPTVKPVTEPWKPTKTTNVNVSSTPKPTVGSTVMPVVHAKPAKNSETTVKDDISRKAAKSAGSDSPQNEEQPREAAKATQPVDNGITIDDQPRGTIKSIEEHLRAIKTQQGHPGRPVGEQMLDAVKFIKERQRGNVRQDDDSVRSYRPFLDQGHGNIPNVTRAVGNENIGTGAASKANDNTNITAVTVKPENPPGVLKEAKLRDDGTFKEVKQNGMGTMTTSTYSNTIGTRTSKDNPKTQIPVPIPIEEVDSTKRVNTDKPVGKPTKAVVTGISATTIVSSAPNTRNTLKSASKSDKTVQCELERFTCLCFKREMGLKVVCKSCIGTVQCSGDRILLAKSRAINWRINPPGTTLGSFFKNVDKIPKRSTMEPTMFRSTAIQTMRRRVRPGSPRPGHIPVDVNRPRRQDATSAAESGTAAASDTFSPRFSNFQFTSNMSTSSSTDKKNPTWKTVERKQKPAKRRSNAMPNVRREVCSHVWNPVEHTQGVEWQGCGTMPVNTPGFVPTVAVGKTPTAKVKPNYVENEVRAATKPKPKAVDSSSATSDANLTAATQNLVDKTDQMVTRTTPSPSKKTDKKEMMDQKDQVVTGIIPSPEAKAKITRKTPVKKTDKLKRMMDKKEQVVTEIIPSPEAKAKVIGKTAGKKTDKLKQIWKQMKAKQKDNSEPDEVVSDKGLHQSAIVDAMADIFLAATADDLDRIDGINREPDEPEDARIARDLDLSNSFADFSGTCEDLLVNTTATEAGITNAQKILKTEFGTSNLKDVQDTTVAQNIDCKHKTGKNSTADKPISYSPVKRSRSLENLDIQATRNQPVVENVTHEYENPFEISGSIRIDDHYAPGKKAGRGRIAEVKVKQKRRGKPNKHLLVPEGEKEVCFMDDNNDGDPGSRLLPIRRGFDDTSEPNPDDGAAYLPDEVTEVETLESIGIEIDELIDGTGENTSGPQPLPEVCPDMRHCEEIPIEVIYGKKGVDEEEERYGGARGNKKKKGRQRGKDGGPKGKPPPLLGMKFDI